MLLGAVIARSNQPERMLPAYYLAVGLANPMAYAATRLQNVVLRFPPRSRTDRLTRRFALRAGTIVSFVRCFLAARAFPLVLRSLQRLAPLTFPWSRVRAAAGRISVHLGLRAHWEGLAALARRTSTILAGNIAFVAALAITAPTCLALKVSGNMIGPSPWSSATWPAWARSCSCSPCPKARSRGSDRRARAWLTKRLAAKKLRFTATACQPSSAP